MIPNKNCVQQQIVRLEDEIVNFIDQYHVSDNYLKTLIGQGIIDRYEQYTHCINNNDDLLLPKYSIIKDFVKKEFNINYVKDKDE